MWPALVASKLFKKGLCSNSFVADCPSCAESVEQSPNSLQLHSFKYKLFVSTWNVGGVAPPDDLNMEDLLDTRSSYCHIYVLGFQEVVPLQASNVLGAEKSKICMRWNSLISEALNNETRGEGGGVPWGYECVISKQMVGLLITVWVRSHIRRHIRHLSVSCVGCGIMGCLGNKGAVSVRFQLHETSFCFVCSHLASGGRQGDEKHRNADAYDIFSRTCFPTSPAHDLSQNILDHEISLPDHEIRQLVGSQEWSKLLENDQLRMELVNGRVFQDWQEGAISFAPTYKYQPNSDIYYECLPGKKDAKKRSPAWCDRIIWYGKGLKQQEYTRCESRLSDHRPVKATFSADVTVNFSIEQIKCQLDMCSIDETPCIYFN